MAALKAYERAVALEPGALYCATRLAHMHHVLGDVAQACRVHRGVLQQSPNYLPSLHALALTLHEAAVAAVGEGRSRRAAQLISEALTALDDCLAISASYRCVWKLLGDLCTLSHRIPGSLITMACVGSRLAGLFPAAVSVLQLGDRKSVV